MFFLICGTMVDNWNIEKLTALFPRKIHFSPNLGIKDSKWPQNRVFWIFWKILLLVFLWNNLKWKLILLPKIRSLHISAISPEKRGYEVDFLHADEHKNFLQFDIITLGVGSQACPKNPLQQDYNIFQYLKENVKDEVGFLPADKHFKGLFKLTQSF